MADTTVVLGSVTFGGVEVPERITFGGRQMLGVQRLIGGQRVVDAMGPDPMDLTWSGRFQGSNATARARALDAMRASGAQQTLTWGGLVYTVVVSDFQADYERFYQIPYRITCVVVSDPSAGSGASLLSSVDDLISGDLSAIAGLSGSLASASLQTSLASVSSAIGAAGSLASATKGTIAALETSVAAAVSVAQSASSALDGSIDGSTPASGANAASSAAALTATLAAIQAQAATQDTQSGLQRIYANLATQSA